MSLPPALLQRLAQRGLVGKQKETEATPVQTENEEVIAEDYDEMDSDEQQSDVDEEYQYPSQYDNDSISTKRNEDNFWLERMKARMGEASSAAGFKGCPNKYNIWHKCTLFCVNRWAEGQTEPSREYMRRYKRMLRKYPLPKGWVEIYDPGCGCYYFANETDGVVSWLSPTHPKSQIGKSAALLRRQMEDSTGDGVRSTSEESSEESEEESRRSPNNILKPQDFPSLQEAMNIPPPTRKQKSRDLDRTVSRQRRDRDRDRGDRDRERDRGDRDRERDRNERDRERDSERYSSSRKHGNMDSDVVDPMDPSSYSDAPRGKWSDGLHAEQTKRKDENNRERDHKNNEKRSRKDSSNSDED